MLGARLSLGGLPSQECRDVEIVARDFACDITDVLLHLLNNVLPGFTIRGGAGSACDGGHRSRRLFRTACFPCLRHELRTLYGVFLVGFLEAGGDYGNL